eukprot:scaffold28850_cov41-Attheya_sp.AAC.2
MTAGDEQLEMLRERRLAQMKAAQAQKRKYLEQGHGTYTSLGEGQDARDVAKEFFDVAKQSERLVVHFYRPATRSCDVFHRHLEQLAQRHVETKFVKINVEGCDEGGGGASFLVEQLGIVVMPTVLIVIKRKAVHHIRGFDELGGEDCPVQSLAYVIGAHGGLHPRDDEQTPPQPNSEGVNSVRMSHHFGKPNNVRASALNNLDDDSDSDFE